MLHATFHYFRLQLCLTYYLMHARQLWYCFTDVCFVSVSLCVGLRNILRKLLIRRHVHYNFNILSIAFVYILMKPKTNLHK